MTTTDDRTTAAAVDPGPLIKLTIADCAAKVLHSAVALGVFGALADGPADADHVAAATGLHERMAPDFLDALAGLGLLERTGTGTATARWPRRTSCRAPPRIWAASSS
ncbi:hypothetical protein ID875_01325 [Streptomyces globisporus]|uniref:O-methyltransferase dimerisation domain-containing protein n=1 Tax=Streptomyces globisporus TaxID=1908 RepID=A0A927GM04_STRGL|nr:hypothetical protein [Streptomyces globisporus]